MLTEIGHADMYVKLHSLYKQIMYKYTTLHSFVLCRGIQLDLYKVMID